jgi:hypothetical protein
VLVALGDFEGGVDFHCVVAGAELGELGRCFGFEVDATWTREVARRDSDFEELKEAGYRGECGNIEV